MTQTRKLAAVMFTDIVGYTALMSRDEESALALLQRNRDLQVPLVARYNGELLKEIGDGTLCCFQSALDAVRCAIAIQKQAAQEEDLSLRIGIHLGDVVFRDGDVFGDGVNVASRIQEVAEPGGICVSEQIYLQIKNRKDVSAEHLGRKTLKNVEDPVGVYSVKPSSPGFESEEVKQDLTAVADLSGLRMAAAQEKSIVVLPFTNMSSDPEQEYFSDGLTEEIISDLSHVRELRVISRTSSMMYKDTKKSLGSICQELDVTYVLEGSVRKAGNNLRITAQLIDAVRDSHLWAKKFAGTLEDVFDIQEQVSCAIVKELRVNLSSEEQEAIGRHEIADVNALECLLRARYEIWKGTESSIARAFEYLSEANETAKDSIEIYSAMVEAHFMGVHLTGMDFEGTMERMEDLADRILQINPKSSHGHYCKGLVQYKKPWGFRDAAKSFRFATESDPTNSPALLMRAVLALQAGRMETALACSDRLLKLDPVAPVTHINRGWIMFLSGDFEASIGILRAVLATDPTSNYLRWCTLIPLAHAGRTEEVMLLVDEMRQMPTDNFALAGILYECALNHRSDEVESLLTPGLVTTAERDESFAWTFSQCFSLLGEKERAIQWLELAIRQGFIHYPWLSEADPFLENIRPEARFKELMAKAKSESERLEV